jgi:hypothetical protein
MADRIVELSASIHAAEGELVGLLVEFHEARGWMGAGVRSLEHWLCVNAGFTLAEGRARAALSDRAAELPHLMGALCAGALSLGATRQASRVATTELDEQVTEIATTATAAQAARVFRSYVVVEAADRRRRRCGVDADNAASSGGEDPGDRRGPATWWRHWWDDHGYLNVDGRLDPTGGAELTAAIDAVAATLEADRRSRGQPRDPGGAEPGGVEPGGVEPGGADPGGADPGGADRSGADRRADPPSAGAPDGAGDEPVTAGAPVSRVDAIGELAAAGLAGLRHRGFTARGGERFSVHVTIDAAALAGMRPGAGVFDSGARVGAELVRSWLGGAHLDVLVHDEGRPLWLSREQRVASPAQRRALLQRDLGCAYPGCGHTRFVDAHHILPWEHGGHTDVDNLVLLCRRHHRLLHAGEYTITTHEGRPRFLDTHHRPIGTGRPRSHLSDGDPGSPHPGGRSSDRPPPLPRPSDPRRTRRPADPLTHYGIDVYVADLLGNRPAALGHPPG